jgi:hypothetical protein
MKESLLSSHDELRIEIATHRLMFRAILGYLASNGETQGQVLSEICGCLEGVGNNAVAADDFDDDLRAASTARAREHMMNFIFDLTNHTPGRA